MPMRWHRCTRAWISKNTSENYDDADAMDEPGDQAGGICRLLGAPGVAAVGWISSSSRRQSDRENHAPYRWLGTQVFIDHLGDHAAAAHHRLEPHQAALPNSGIHCLRAADTVGGHLHQCHDAAARLALGSTSSVGICYCDIGRIAFSVAGEGRRA